jgi:hypothetical protein
MEIIDTDKMTREFMGVSGIFEVIWERLSEKDYARFMRISNYLNDVVNMNLYDHSPIEIKRIHEKGTRIMKNLLKRYGAKESWFTPESLENMSELSYEFGKKTLEGLSYELQSELDDLVMRKLTLGRIAKDKILYEKNKVKTSSPSQSSL